MIAARSKCNATVQSLPPLKLKAISSGLPQQRKVNVGNDDDDEISRIIEQTL